MTPEHDDMVNLLEETLSVLREHGKQPADVSHVQWDGGWCRWHHFEPVAARITYDSGYGSPFVKDSLMVVGIAGWWMERFEYDGSEHWDFKEAPGFPATEGRAPTPDDLLESYRGVRADSVVIAEDLPLAPPSGSPEPVALVPAPGSPVDVIQAAWARVTHTDLPGRTRPALDLTWTGRGSYLLRATAEGQAAQAEVMADRVAVPGALASDLRGLFSDLLQKVSHARLRDLLTDDDLAAAAPRPLDERTAATVAAAAEQMAREEAGKVFVPPEDVPAIMGHFREVYEKATGVKLTPVDPTQHVFVGEAAVRREDGGQALIYTVTNTPHSGMASEKMFVRVQSWDETGEHRDLTAMGTRLKVTVEAAPE